MSVQSSLYRVPLSHFNNNRKQKKIIFTKEKEKSASLLYIAVGLVIFGFVI